MCSSDLDILDHSLENLRTLVDINTVIGTPINQGGVTIIPVSKVSFGFGSGGSEIPSDKPKMPFGGGSGGGVTITPIAFIVISDGKTDVVQISAPSNTADRIVELVPQMFDRITDVIADKKAAKAEKEAAAVAEKKK